ncbi:MAG: hypothetical protein ACR2N7_04165, partial [Acidimicrobiia bacterium]
VFAPPWRTAKLVGVGVSLGFAVFYPLGWGAVVLVTGAMLTEPMFLRRPPGDDDGPDNSVTGHE